MAGRRLEFFQDSKRLMRQRHAVGAAHLHLCCRNVPLGPVEIEFLPFGMAEFARPDKDQGGQSQSQGCCRIPLEAINGAQQGANSFGLKYSGSMPDPGRGKRATQIGRWITLGSARRYCVAKYDPTGAAQSPRRLISAARLDVSKR